jgi:hypothetical protein
MKNNRLFMNWSTQADAASVEVLDGNDNVIRRMDVEAAAGMNSVEWDLLVDEELALAALVIS